MAREPFPSLQKADGNGGTSWLTRGLEVGTALTLVVYAALGIVYLAMDHDVVTGCHPSNTHVHIVWATDIWVYVLVSIVIACVLALWLIVLATFKQPGAPGEVSPWCGVARRLLWGDSFVWDDTEPLDWRLLWGGLTLSCLGILLSVLAFWGYVEVYLANPWCDNKAVVWEELDLVGFGRVTFWLQLVFAAFFLAAGWISWVLPFALEAKRLLSEDGTPSGTPHRGSARGKR